MKQLKFLTTISLEGKPIWYKDHIYEVMSEGSNGQGREMYKLICEDLKPRGIDKVLANKMYKVIEIEDKKEIEKPKIIKEDITIFDEEKSDVLIKEKVENSQEKKEKIKPKVSSNKKKKTYKN